MRRIEEERKKNTKKRTPQSVEDQEKNRMEFLMRPIDDGVDRRLYPGTPNIVNPG